VRQNLHSFPTRRSSDLIKLLDRRPNPGQIRVSHLLVRIDPSNPVSADRAKRRVADIYSELQRGEQTWEELVERYSEDEGTKKTRSEEHTSELQSRENLV